MRHKVISWLPTLLVLAVNVSAQEASFSLFGEGCGAGGFRRPSLDRADGSLPSIDDRFSVVLQDLPFRTAMQPGAASLVLGFSASQWLGLSLPLNLDSFGAPGCTLYASAQQVFAQQYSGDFASWVIDIPSDPSLVGAHFFVQGVAVDPSANPLGLVTTNAGEGVIGLNRGPEVSIVFPPRRSLTHEDSVIVRGTARDQNGIAEVRVNGQLATTSDGYENWQLRISLPVGETAIAIEAIDSLGFTNGNDADVLIESQARLFDPKAIVFDAQNNRALVATSFSVVSIDLSNGNRVAISDFRTGSGVPTDSIRDIALDGIRLLLTSSKRIIELDLGTLHRQLISNALVPPSPSGASSSGLALQGGEAIISVGESNQQMGPARGWLIGVDLISGNTRLISGESIGIGVALREPRNIALDGTRVLISDVGSIRAVDLLTGDRSVLADGFRGAGPSLAMPRGITVDNGRALVVEAGFRALYELDLITGTRTLVSSAAKGDGPNFMAPWGVVMANGSALVTDAELQAVLSVDLLTGDRTVVSRSNVGSGPSLRSPIAFGVDATRMFVLDWQSQSLVEIDPETGDRRVISNRDRGSGPGTTDPTGLVVEGGRVIILDAGLDALLEVDPSTGNRRVISSDAVGGGPRFDRPAAIALSGNQALVMDHGLAALFSVDLTTGDREVISGPSRGAGEQFQLVDSMVVDGNRVLMVLVINSFPINGKIIAVDLATGDRSVFADNDTGTGPDLWTAESITLDGDRVLLASVRDIIAVDLLTGNRSIIATPRPGSPAFAPNGIILDGDQVTMLCTNQRWLTRVDLLTGEQVIIAK